MTNALARRQQTPCKELMKSLQGNAQLLARTSSFSYYPDLHWSQKAIAAKRREEIAKAKEELRAEKEKQKPT